MKQIRGDGDRLVRTIHGEVVEVGATVQVEHRGKVRTGRVTGDCPDGSVWVLLPRASGGVEQRKIHPSKLLAVFVQQTLFGGS